MTFVTRISIPILISALLSIGIVSAVDKDETEVLEFLKLNVPDVHQEMVRLKREEPAVYEETYEEVAAAKREYLRVKIFNPEAADAYLKMFQIDFNVVAVSDEIAKSSNAAEIAKLREKVKEEIRQHVGEGR